MTAPDPTTYAASAVRRPRDLSDWDEPGHLGLVDRIVEDAFEPAAGPAEPPTPDPLWRNQSRLRRSLGFAATMLVLGTVFGIVTASSVSLPQAEVERRTAIVDRITAEREANADRERQIEALRAEIEALVVAAGGESAGGIASDAVAVAAGATRVGGPGLAIELRNPPQVDPADDSSAEAGGAVLDLDVQVVVNGLWEAGAEAVSVNGQRVTSITAIRSAAGVVLVNYRPVLSPYRIAAVGDPDVLSARFAASAAGRWVRYLSSDQGITVTSTGAAALDLPAGAARVPRYAVAEEAG